MIRNFVITAILSSILMACGSLQKREASVPNEKPVDVADEVSLKADRKELEELRKDIPDEVKRDNDELALILGLMTAKADEDPSKIRDRFNTALRKRRENFDKDHRRKREDFTKSERKMREDFLKNAKQERDSFTKAKNKPDERKRFFDDQDERRREFFADQSDKRKDFESNMTEERKTFEDYVRERTNEFNQEHRAYSATYYERKKNVALKKRMDDKAKELEKQKEREQTRAQTQDELDEFRNIPKTPATPLGPSGN